MHDIDDRLTHLFEAAGPTSPVPDRRTAIRRSAHRRAVRRRAGVSIVAVALVVATALVPLLHSREQGVAAGPPADQPLEHAVTVPGVRSSIRVSLTDEPVRGYRAFGSIPLGGGAVTGAVETTRADGSAIALVALTAGPTTRSMEVRGPRGEMVRTPVESGHAFVVLDLEERDSQLVLELETFDDRGATAGVVRVAPSIQDPITCDTNSQMLDDRDELGDPSYMAFLDAYLGAPLPAVCDR
jgi:hypothetical protein